ncbi:MAG: membrane lipoprotein lipid attachment site-containing protein [Candidatus Aenigmarchaeota archaeon]|nr:membrane lipoprotein lipid attachment site-containing protein [Candidatus Aenigmarchaeota archaeon]
MKKMISLLVLVLFVSGCTSFSGINFFGQNQEVKEVSEDVIVIENINVVPTSPLIAGDQFSLSFQMINEDEMYDVPVEYKLLDDGLCSFVRNQAFRDTGSFTLVPGQVEFIEWTFDTPESSDIAYIRTICPIRFKTTYYYFAESEIEISVIDKDRYMQLQQSGEFTTFTPTLTVGRGPIKIYMELGATLPIREGGTLPVYITVEDKGDGLMTKIPERKLVMGIPEEFAEGAYCDFMSLDETIGGYAYFTNTQSIPFVSKETPKMKCTFIAPDVSLEQTYFANAYFLDFAYDKIKEVEVEVQPLA